MTLVLIVLALLTLIVLGEIAALVKQTFDNRSARLGTQTGTRDADPKTTEGDNR